MNFKNLDLSELADFLTDSAEDFRIGGNWSAIFCVQISAKSNERLETKKTIIQNGENLHYDAKFERLKTCLSLN